MSDESAVVKAGQLIGEPRKIGDAYFVVIPQDSEIHDLDDYLPNPRKTVANPVLSDVASFIDYVNRFKTEATIIGADLAQFHVRAVIDYHTKDKPSHQGHVASYGAPRAREWSVWRGASGKRMDQTSFAQFIEDNQVDIRFPTGADVLEVSRSLSAHKAVEFVSSVSLADGSRQLTYNETVDSVTSRGNIKVPDEFILGIPVFFGGTPYEVRARLRYRIEKGQLSLWYDLYRPEAIEKDAFDQVIKEVSDGTSLTVWRGTV